MIRPTSLTTLFALSTSALLAVAAGACRSGDPSSPTGRAESAVVKTFRICPGPNARNETVFAFFDAREGDTIEFCEGHFDMPTGLLLHSKRGITIRGAGQGKSVLSFKQSDSAEGLNISHSDGVVVQGLTVLDTPGNAVRIFKSSFVTIRDVAAGWSDRDPATPGHQVSGENGAYALYPVLCRHVLIEDSYAFGSSDAGIYVGQSSDVIVRRNLAKYNVAGYEFENTYRALFEDNVATENTGGFLIFDLPNLAQYGEKNIVRNNRSFANNIDNFAAPGNTVGVVPRGTGMMVFATDQLEIYGNQFFDNDTVGLSILNYGLVDPTYPDKKYDFFPEGLHVHDNAFRDNGGNPQLPDPSRGESSLLPTIVRLKNLGRMSHIVWDGGVDKPNTCADYPKDEDGIRLDQPNPNEDRYEARTDERGRPNYQLSDPDPSCKYNAWKFAEGAAAPTRPDNWLCIEDNNTYENTKLSTLLVTPFVNAKFSTPNPVDPPNLELASNDLTPHRCVLPNLATPVLNLPFIPDPNSDEARPPDSEVTAACNAVTPGEVNWNALGRYNCPKLEQYGLFASGEEPRANPNGGGVPFELTSTLFADYAVKYRFLFLPPGQKATYRDHTNSVTETLDFPVGTVLAKTFAFRTDDASGNRVREDVVETRLLIKRQTSKGPVWTGLPFVWKTDASGKRVAELAVEGRTVAATFDYLDPDPDVKGADGQRKRYTGQVDHYGVPAGMNCITCHGGDERESGSPPIGLKPRLLNRDNVFPDVGRMNQLAYLAQRGLLVGMPGEPGQVERAPRYNVPGDSGFAPDSDSDVHARARAYLEVSCMHCHSGGGNGSNSGLFLDAYRTVNVNYGICKKPVAAGRGSGGRKHDIVPGKGALPLAQVGKDASILFYRVSSDEAGVRMPPVSRTLVHDEGTELLGKWIQNVLPTEDTQDEESCTGLGGIFP